MVSIQKIAPDDNIKRFEREIKGNNPKRAYNFAVAYAEKNLFLKNYDKYRDIKYGHDINILDIRKMGDKVARYRAQRGEVEKIMEMVSEGAILEMQALRILLENRRYSDFTNLADKYGTPQKARNDISFWLLVELYSAGNETQAREIVNAGLATEYDSKLAMETAASDKRVESRLWAVQTLRDAVDDAEKKEGIDYIKSTLQPFEDLFNKHNENEKKRNKHD